MTSTMKSTPLPPKSSSSGSSGSFQRDPRYHAAVAQAARIRCIQLIRSGWLRPARPRSQSCSGQWKPRMDLIDDPSSPNVIAIFELPGVKNDNITLQIKETRLVVFGNRVDPFAEALAAAAAAVQAQSSEANGNGSDSRRVTSSTGDSTTTAPNAPDKSTRELRYGSFYRTIPVPDGIKQAEVTAGLQDGILTVTWPRIPAAARQLANPTTPPGNSITNSGIMTPHESGSNKTNTAAL